MSTTLYWFCLKAQTKREHIAADHLRQIPGTAVFLPRVRFQRKTVRGLAWFTEALFPGYVFARFNFQQQFRQVNHAGGVRGIVHFGDRWPTIPDEAIAELQLALGTENIHTITDPLAVGRRSGSGGGRVSRIEGGGVTGDARARAGLGAAGISRTANQCRDRRGRSDP